MRLYKVSGKQWLMKRLADFHIYEIIEIRKIFGKLYIIINNILIWLWLSISCRTKLVMGMNKSKSPNKGNYRLFLIRAKLVVLMLLKVINAKRSKMHSNTSSLGISSQESSQRLQILSMKWENLCDFHSSLFQWCSLSLWHGRK